MEQLSIFNKVIMILNLSFIGEVNWVQCDRCEEWFHLLCVGLAEDEVSEEEEYECFSCKQGRGQQPVLVCNHGKQGTMSPSKVPGMFNYSEMPVIKAEQDMDNILVCNEEVEVAMDTSQSSSYNRAMETYHNSLIADKEDNEMATSSKVTQFSYETDESSQDEMKSSFSVGTDSNEAVSMATQISVTGDA